MTIVAVPTAVPAFVGYTEKAERQARSLLTQPFRVTSMAEYAAHFGGAAPSQFSVAASTTATTASPFVRTFAHQGRNYLVTRTDTPFLLFECLRLFFDNGGRACYIVSAGTYGDDIDAHALTTAIDALVAEPEPTLLVVPDAVRLPPASCSRLQQAMLAHCGQTANRFAILDVAGGDRDRLTDDPIAAFRSQLGTDFRDRGAAYYPWLHTSLVQPAALGADRFGLEESNPLYPAAAEAAATVLNLLPPAAAIAGIYATVDATRGVWAAPANVALNDVIGPAVPINHQDQEDLNVHAQGFSINAIRSFAGRGTLVWGQRTLDGNHLDYRYVNVRRTVLMLEASMGPALASFSSAPNDATTWTAIKRMIEDFLTPLWRGGALHGMKAEEAFAVKVGLGETMTAADLQRGILRVMVLVAISRPAEFIEITFQQNSA